MKVLGVLFLWCLAGMAWADPVWIDVRSEAEFQQQHKPGALLMPHGEIAQRITAAGIEKDAEVYLYCRSGKRAGIAKQALEQLGYSKVINVGGLEDALTHEMNQEL